MSRVRFLAPTEWLSILRIQFQGIKGLLITTDTRNPSGAQTNMQGKHSWKSHNFLKRKWQRSLVIQGSAQCSIFIKGSRMNRGTGLVDPWLPTSHCLLVPRDSASTWQPRVLTSQILLARTDKDGWLCPWHFRHFPCSRSLAMTTELHGGQEPCGPRLSLCLTSFSNELLSFPSPLIRFLNTSLFPWKKDTF